MPKTEEKKVVRYEDSAEIRNDLSGWCCTECWRYWGVDDGAEHMARWCCATSIPCDTEGCEGRARRHYTKCDPCIARGHRERYLAKEEAEWDGDTPIVIDGDRYFFDAGSLEDELRDRCYENGGPIRLEDIEFELCRPMQMRWFSMADFLCDDLPDNWDEDCSEIDGIVNDWIKKNMGGIWETNGQRPTIESVRRHLSDDWDQVED